ncbi:hypothetical protein C1O66_18490 [Paucibacter aquatile]|uniref:Solute-binding protein family 3/N-terminal domain-containing protein n=1 Tax=Kinneretia aquatilis TaxID=2070761 RepID=A0A2N8L0S9_9BURK|nr:MULTISPECIES: transporter substrate-binding domain-containing protein [Roseateles]PND39320.1 hypothetical protein C1O66_18490 [Paucibacter aquatile]
MQPARRSRLHALLAASLLPPLLGCWPGAAHAAPPPATTPATSAGAEAGRLTVLLQDLPPYSQRGPGDRPQGYAVDLTQQLCERARLDCSYEFSSWPRILKRAQLEANVLIPAVVRLPERERHYLWVGQTAVRYGALYRLKRRDDVRLSSLQQLGSYRIGVVKDDVSERELLALGPQVSAQLDRSGDYGSMLRRFFAERTELVALNQTMAPGMLRQFGYEPGEVELLLRFSESRPSMALSLNSDPALLLRLQQTWEAMRRDGTVAAIAARHPIQAPD